MSLKPMKLFATTIWEGWWHRNRMDKKPHWVEVKMRGMHLEIEVNGYIFKTDKRRLFDHTIDELILECYKKSEEQS